MSQDLRRGPRDPFLRFCFRVFGLDLDKSFGDPDVLRGHWAHFRSHAARSKIDQKSYENPRKSNPKRPPKSTKFDLGRSWAPMAASGTRPDALGTAFGRPNDAPKPIWGRSGRAKSGQELSKRLAGAPQTRSKRLRDRSQDAHTAVRVTKRSRNGLQIDF